MIIKVCGMTRAEDVEFCDALGIDLLGFIFHPESPRNVAPEWVATQKPGSALKTGVFVRQGVEEVSAIAKAVFFMVWNRGLERVSQVGSKREALEPTDFAEMSAPRLRRLSRPTLLFFPCARRHGAGRAAARAAPDAGVRPDGHGVRHRVRDGNAGN